MVNINKILKDNKYLFVFNLTEKLFYFILFILIARYCNNDLYGKIAISFVVHNTIAMFLTFGIPFFLQREIAKLKDTNESNLSEYIFVYLWSSIIYILISAIIWVCFYNNIDIIIFGIVCVSIYLLNFSSLFYTVFTGFYKYKLQFYFQILFKFSAMLIIFILFILKVDLRYILLTLLISSFLNLVILFYYVDHNLISINLKKINLKITLNRLVGIFPLYLASLFNFMYDKLDILIISQILDYSSVAYYSVAYSIYKSTSIFFSFIVTDAYTKISKMEKRLGYKQILVNKFSVTILIVSGFCTLLTFFLSDFIVNLLYTNKYQSSVLLIKIMSFGIIFIGLNNYTGTVMNAIGLFKENMFVTLIGLLFNILFNILLIKKYGIIVAAIITLITEIIILSFDLIFIIRYYKQKFMKNDQF